MYLDHFQLKSQPFCEHASVAALWSDGRMNEGLARLDHLLTHGTLGLVTGASGVAKSALLKKFLHGLSPPHCTAVYCHLTHLSGFGVLKLLVSQLGEVPRGDKGQLYEQLQQRAARVEGTLLLVFDEAHLLTAEALTDLRLLVSSALDGPPLKIVLAGQEPLRATLKRTQHADLLHRLSVRFQLRPLTREQTAQYIDFQLTHAEGSPQLCDDSVKTLIHEFTGGVPRQINNLATACLVQATARKKPRIDDEIFQQAAAECQLP
jgi:general secretion pathway protein A